MQTKEMKQTMSTLELSSEEAYLRSLSFQGRMDYLREQILIEEERWESAKWRYRTVEGRDQAFEARDLAIRERDLAIQREQVVVRERDLAIRRAQAATQRAQACLEELEELGEGS